MVIKKNNWKIWFIANLYYEFYTRKEMKTTCELYYKLFWSIVLLPITIYSMFVAVVTKYFEQSSSHIIDLTFGLGRSLLTLTFSWVVYLACRVATSTTPEKLPSFWHAIVMTYITAAVLAIFVSFLVSLYESHEEIKLIKETDEEFKNLSWIKKKFIIFKDRTCEPLEIKD
jgi:hypothetical protein